VFTAFVQPEVLAKFWLSEASGQLEAGRKVRWDFQVEGASAEVLVEAIVQDRRISVAFDVRVSRWCSASSRPCSSKARSLAW
jgi:uncharacterized protein YndB with AHSA1/START domain